MLSHLVKVVNFTVLLFVFVIPLGDNSCEIFVFLLAQIYLLVDFCV